MASTEEQRKKWKAYYYANRERKLKQRREYVERNREKINAKCSSYYHANRDEVLKRNREYQARNRDAILAQRKDHYAKNKEVLCLLKRVAYLEKCRLFSVDAEAYAAHRKYHREYNRKRSGSGKTKPSMIIPDFACKGQDILSRNSVFLWQNHTKDEQKSFVDFTKETHHG